MARFGVCGGSYTSQSLNADAQRALNWYPETNDTNSKSAVSQYPTPGLAAFVTLGDSPLRGLVLHTATNRLFAVAGASLYEVLVNGANVTSNKLGAVTNDGKPASMAISNTQLMVASGLSGYCFTLATNVLTSNPANLTSPLIVQYSDGFFVSIQGGGSNQWQASNALDGTIWNALSVTAVSVFPDNIVSMLVDHREAWIIGQNKIAPYYDSGATPFPFDVIPGGYIEQGGAAAFCINRLDNTLFWLGASERGTNGIAWRANGYLPTRISNHAVETAWKSYPKISDAVSYAFEFSGHIFWHINFPSANNGNGASWRYDVATGNWHEVCFLNGGVEQMHRSQYHAVYNGLHLVGDPLSGNIYQMDDSILTDFGNPIKRLRRAPHISEEQEWLRHVSMQVDVEAGQVSLNGTSADVESITLADSNGVLWAVTINDAGAIVTASGAPGPAQTIIINDNSTGTTSWQLVVSVGGVVSGSAVTFGTQYPQTFNMATSGTALQSGLQVSNAGVVAVVAPFQGLRGPQLMLRWSDDGGHTWSNYYQMGCGKVGETKFRAIQRRLGKSRDRVYEVSTTDAFSARLVDAYLQATSYDKPVQRLSTKLRQQA